MLILSRRAGESIILNENITLTVVSIKGKQVRIGIDAPDSVSVHREEVFQRILDGEATGYTPGEKAKLSGSSDDHTDDGVDGSPENDVDDAPAANADTNTSAGCASGGDKGNNVTILHRRRRSVEKQS